ncbi:chloride channel protein [Sphingobacterium chuzhouense]|uniref:Chloride channel protein n=1 Tax=Sphingobacterium chuzhouense TaxID=1742264 RepID=A0ABR7XQT5_9SPHI|nr:chloride channel protein [Sphingobacterium chuzhouense]MBD1421530.1 chloride channel protein [Sphingobacterium chuzhouense]
MIKSVSFLIRLFFKWLLLILAISGMVGSLSAVFLYALNEVTLFRETHLWIISLLPFAGVFIVWWYQRYGENAQKGNNLLLEEYYYPTSLSVPWKMAPMVILATLITHLFGGSAGREGTAVQYGGTVAAQFNKFVPLGKQDRRILLLCGIAGGFASLFGTPLAGAIFAIEMVQLGRIRWRGVGAILATALLSNWACGLYGDLHTHYPPIGEVPTWSFSIVAYLLLAGSLFGLASMLFRYTGDIFNNGFKKIKQPLLRPFIGGILVILAVFLLQSTKHIGLGIPTIIAAFQQPLPTTDFLIKIGLTALTLSAGFKGGEVTPLFFIGATLGNALAPLIPLPLALLAATGFVSVFAGCTKTPIACTVMAMELFGWQYGLFFLITCLISYVSSGKKGIYSAQRIKNFKLF